MHKSIDEKNELKVEWIPVKYCFRDIYFLALWQDGIIFWGTAKFLYYKQVKYLEISLAL